MQSVTKASIPVQSAECITVDQLCQKLLDDAQREADFDQRLLDRARAVTPELLDLLELRTGRRRRVLKFVARLQGQAADRGELNKVMAWLLPPCPGSWSTRHRAPSPGPRGVQRARSSRRPARVARAAAVARRTTADGVAPDGEPPPVAVIGWRRPAGALVGIDVRELPVGTVMLPFFVGHSGGQTIVDAGALIVFDRGSR
jgi:hypothetical protein